MYVSSLDVTSSIPNVDTIVKGSLFPHCDTQIKPGELLKPTFSVAPGSLLWLHKILTDKQNRSYPHNSIVGITPTDATPLPMRETYNK